MNIIDLKDEGCDLANTRENVIHPGSIYRKDMGSYLVWDGEQMVACGLASRLRRKLDEQYSAQNSNKRARQTAGSHKNSEPLVVGDRVRWRKTGDGNGLIVELSPRQNALSRRAARPMVDSHTFEQVMVANIDLVAAVFSAAKPAPKWNLLDRYLAAAEINNLDALVCITKLDLVAQNNVIDPELMNTVETYEKIGYPVILTSVLTGSGLETVRKFLQGKTSAMVGKSGVGKTSLLNALQPGLGRRVGQVGKSSGKGRHTTSHLEMFPLDFGGALVDTPGMREFGLWEIHQDELAWCFREMRPYIGECKYGLSCAHDEEPGCAVRQAVLDGQISPERYRSYLRLRVDP